MAFNVISPKIRSGGSAQWQKYLYRWTGFRMGLVAVDLNWKCIRKNNQLIVPVIYYPQKKPQWYKTTTIWFCAWFCYRGTGIWISWVACVQCLGSQRVCAGLGWRMTGEVACSHALAQLGWHKESPVCPVWWAGSNRGTQQGVPLLGDSIPGVQGWGCRSSEQASGVRQCLVGHIYHTLKSLNPNQIQEESGFWARRSARVTAEGIEILPWPSLEKHNPTDLWILCIFKTYPYYMV